MSDSLKKKHVLIVPPFCSKILRLRHTACTRAYTDTSVFRSVYTNSAFYTLEASLQTFPTAPSRELIYSVCLVTRRALFLRCTGSCLCVVVVFFFLNSRMLLSRLFHFPILTAVWKHHRIWDQSSLSVFLFFLLLLSSIKKIFAASNRFSSLKSLSSRAQCICQAWMYWWGQVPFVGVHGSVTEHMHL